MAAMKHRFKLFAAEVQAAPRGVALAPEVLFAFQVAVIAVRNDLWEAGGDACQRNLAKPATFLSSRQICGKPKVPRSLMHSGYFCECVTWQWENLGDGNAAELKSNRCPIPRLKLGHAPENGAPGNGNDRKGVNGAFDVAEVFPARPTSGAWAMCGDVQAGLLWARGHFQDIISRKDFKQQAAGWDAKTRTTWNAGIRSYKKMEKELEHGKACAEGSWEINMLFLSPDDPLLVAGPRGFSTFAASAKAIAIALEAQGVFVPVRWRWHKLTTPTKKA